MSKTTKVSFNINNDLLKYVNQQMASEPQTNQTQALNTLINQGIHYQTELKNSSTLQDSTRTNPNR